MSALTRPCCPLLTEQCNRRQARHSHRCVADAWLRRSGARQCLQLRPRGAGEVKAAAVSSQPALHRMRHQHAAVQDELAAVGSDSRGRTHARCGDDAARGQQRPGGRRRSAPAAGKRRQVCPAACWRRGLGGQAAAQVEAADLRGAASGRQRQQQLQRAAAPVLCSCVALTCMW